MKEINNLLNKIKLYGFVKSLDYILKELIMKSYYQIMKKSYSQKQEDLFIDEYFHSKDKGFYVDVGANNPSRFSNTKKFYDKGWHGINIEPDLLNFRKFVINRNRDLNLNIGVGTKPGYLKFYRFFPDTLSTFSKTVAKLYIKQGYKLEEEIRVKINRLEYILSQYLGINDIDFLSIDTEGSDLDVLKSNNWNKYKPKLICIESATHGNDYKNDKENIGAFLAKIGYKKVYDNNLNSIYVLNIADMDNFSKTQAKEFDKFAELRKDRVSSLTKSLDYEYAKIVCKMGGDLAKKSILDLGCGTGRYSIELAKKAKEVIGCDISEKSIEIANLTAKREKLDNFTGIVGELSNYSYSDYFDDILIVNVFHHTKNKNLLLSSIRKALKKDVKLTIFEFNPLNALFIPFLVLTGQTKSHLNLEYWRSNIRSLKATIIENGFSIDGIEKYAYLPTSLYNYSMFFEKINRLLNNIPLINNFNAFNIIICTKKDIK